MLLFFGKDRRVFIILKSMHMDKNRSYFSDVLSLFFFNNVHEAVKPIYLDFNCANMR